MRKQRASITVFTAIVLVAIMLVGFVSTDLACMLNADTIVNSASNLALDSALAGYDKVLYENYGLMGVQLDKINAPYQKVIKANLKNDKNYSNIFLFDNLNAKVEGAYPLSTTTVLEEQILNQIENGYVPNNFLADYKYLKDRDDFKLLSCNKKYEEQYEDCKYLANCQAYLLYLRNLSSDVACMDTHIYDDNCLKDYWSLINGTFFIDNDDCDNDYYDVLEDIEDCCECTTDAYLYMITESYSKKPTARKLEKLNTVLKEILMVSILFNYNYNSFFKHHSIDELGTKTKEPTKTDGSFDQFNKNALTKVHNNINKFWKSFGKKGELPTLDNFYKELNDYLKNPDDKKLADTVFEDAGYLSDLYSECFNYLPDIYEGYDDYWDWDGIFLNEIISSEKQFVNLDKKINTKCNFNCNSSMYSDFFNKDYKKLSVINKATGKDNFPADKNERIKNNSLLFCSPEDTSLGKKQFDFSNSDYNKKFSYKNNCICFYYDIDINVPKALSFLNSDICSKIKDCRSIISYLDNPTNFEKDYLSDLYDYSNTLYKKTYSFSQVKDDIQKVNINNSVQDETTAVIDSYIIDNFTCFTSEKNEENIFDKPKDNSFFPNCQIEYILNGLSFTGDGSYNSEISGVIYKIYGLRLAENYAAVCDYIKTKEFKKIALECSPYNIGNMQEYLATQRANDWIGLESLYETYEIINGESVPAEKTLDNMHYDCTFEENEQDYSAPRTVVDYKNYLLAFLSTMDHDVKMERLSKLISMGMKNLTGEDKPLYTYYGYLKSTVEVDSRYLFLSQLKFTGFEQQNAAGAQRLRKETIRGY